MENLEQILPHKKPMIVLDRVCNYSFEEKFLEAEVTIRENSIFYDKTIKGVTSLLGIELMAQAIGCYAYYKSGKKEPKIGFLLGTRLYNNKIEIFRLGEKFNIRVKEIYFDDGISSFECLIYNREDEIGSATVNVYRKEE